MVPKETPETIQPSNTEEVPNTPTQAGNEVPPAASDEDDLDFVVTEAHDQDPEMVGGFKSTETERLGIESPAELMQAEAGARQTEAPRRVDRNPFYAIPEPAPAPEVPQAAVPPAPVKKEDPAASRDKIERLSEEQLKEISKRMRAEARKGDYLTDEEKQQLISAIGHGASDYDPEANVHRGTGFATAPIIPPKRAREAHPTPVDIELSGDSPKMSKRSRGVAYYAKGYIHVTGQQELHEGDEMMIAGREYVLRPKKFSNKTIAITIASVAAVLVFVLGMMFSSSADIGDGRIIGMVLDAAGNPVLTGGKVQFPELGQSYEVNGEGFFKTDRLNAGSYRIEYLSGNTIVAADYATVADDNITTVTLRPATAQDQAAVTEPARPAATPNVAAVQPVAPVQAQVERAETKPTPSEPTRNRPAAGPAQAKLTLSANVDGARLTIDGSVLGAGNLTYTKLKPGQHNYLVSKDGYKPVSGTVDLKADQTTNLEITLSPNTVESKPQPRAELEYYQSAVSAMGRNDYNSALTDLGRAIEANPSYADAYVRRADVYRQLNNVPAAHEDYLRGAEIFQVRNEYGPALSAYENAIKTNPKSVAALLGRGAVYLAHNEALAAIADFDMVTRLDKRNVDAYIGLGRARYNQGQFDKASKHFKDARSLEAENPVIHQYLMLSHFGEGEFKEVQKDYDKFLRCANENQVQQLNSDPKFAPVLRVIEH